MAKILKILVGLIVVAAIVVGAYFWLQGRQGRGEELELVAVERGSITEKAVAVGQIEPRLKFEVKSKISGIVKRCAVDVGDRVAAGDPLFEIVPDPTPGELVEAERRLEAAKSAHARAAADWQRSQELARQGVISAEEADARREAFELAKIELDTSRDNLELTRAGRISGRGREMESIIRAPAAGIVLERNVDPGDPVVPLTSFQEGTVMAAVADMSDLIFKGTVDEIDVGKLKVGVPARLNIGALPGEKVTGRLNRIAPQAKEEEGARLFEVEIELDPPENPEMVLRAGYSSTADLVIREKTGILVLPERLVLFSDAGAATFVEVPAGEPEAEPRKVAIATGLPPGLNIEIVSGLEEGAEVVERPPREIF
ncbi:MAG: efflux RND transporter periplasmic adaptor subunit [Thermoanaerobaculia bacterium]|nr:efflux RND transporter periplasmic adaptor subunit [Thermoanaerobaculia bacterium]